MNDYGSGLDPASLSVVADFNLIGHKPGRTLAPTFKPKSQGVYEFRLPKPLVSLKDGCLIITIRDKQGNQAKIDRTFSVSRKKLALR
jgi:hypothetical protein